MIAQTFGTCNSGVLEMEKIRRAIDFFDKVRYSGGECKQK